MITEKLREVHHGRKAENSWKGFLGAGAAFVRSVLCRSGIVAILDYRDEKIARLYKLRRDTDENYIYSE